MIWKGNVERRIYIEKIKEDSGSVVGIEPCSYPISGGGGTAKADTETKASITSSKMQFTYAKKGADVQSSLMFCENTIRLNMMEKEQPKALKV